MIAVFGSINLDLVARVARLPRPGETLAGESFATWPGGKGANQALAAHRAGARVAMFGAVGRDAFAAAALALLRDAGIDLAGVRESDRATGIALIHVDAAGENAITVIAGANALACAESVPDAVLGPGTTLLLQLETPAIEGLALARRARERGARVVLNPAPVATFDATSLGAVDVLIANRSEAETIARMLQLPAEAAAFASALCARYGIAAVVTLGAQGALAAAGDALYRLPAPDVKAVDTVGAGDAFVGALAAALDRGEAMPAALVQGCAAGALTCTRPGAQAAMPRADEIATLAARLQSRVAVSTLAAP